MENNFIKNDEDLNIIYWRTDSGYCYKFVNDKTVRVSLKEYEEAYKKRIEEVFV